MDRERWWHLTREAGGELTTEERRQGWHFCPEYDEELTQGEERREDGSCAWCGFDGRKVGAEAESPEAGRLQAAEGIRTSDPAASSPQPASSECPGAHRFRFGDGLGWLCSLCPQRLRASRIDLLCQLRRRGRMAESVGYVFWERD